jgi:cell division transport system ATP-binding protein
VNPVEFRLSARAAEAEPDRAGGAGVPVPMIAAEALTQQYGGVTVLDNINLRVARGEFVALIGSAGAGKSTLLRLFAALEAPTAGAVTLAGLDLARLNRRARATLRRALGVVPQDAPLLRDRDTLANVMLPARIAGASAQTARERARAALERVGMDTRPLACDALSGGHRQRVALARALVNQPALILADEPCAHLDAAGAASILRLLDEFAATGITVGLATHSAAGLPARARTLRIDAGRLAP